jgi:acyl carrier protein
LPFDLQKEGLIHLAAWLIQEGITIYSSAVSVFRHFVSTLTGTETFPALRVIYTGSEPVTKRDVELYKAHFPPTCIFINTLGANETSTICQYFIDQSTSIPGNIVPVGYPVQDKTVLLLDEEGKEVGTNTIGEIAIKSRYLALGYWQKPELTQTVFRADPQGGEEQIYHTGDLGRLLPDGCLEHLGRKDFQVKIRGYRVEVAEIEMALLDLAMIKEAIVIVQEEQPGEKQLVAYVVPHPKDTLSLKALRSSLREKLPAYMLPATFVVLDALPRTPNGKIDRRALPAPSSIRPERETHFVMPRTPIEETLATIWAEVLGVEPIGIHDHFFELGGHSLLATQIITRIVHTFRIELPIRSLFEAPTVEAMARIIMQHQAERAGQDEMARMLAEIEALSEEEVQAHLVGERGPEKRGEKYESQHDS